MGNKVVIGVELETKGFEQQIQTTEAELKRLVNTYEKALNPPKGYKANEETLSNLRLSIEKTKNKLIELKKKQDDLNKSNISQISKQMNNIGNGIENVITKVSKWALAVFGIRSAYSLVRNAISTISQYNEQVATDVEYIRFALATVLQPVIEQIIKLAYTLLQYVNYIAQAWFGVNLFANASTKAFQNSNKALKESNKQAKELQKTITGFDEMNILQANGDVTSGGGGGGVTPSIDVSKMTEFDPAPFGSWLDKVKEFLLKGFDEIIKNIKKVMKDLGFSQDMIDAFSFFIDGVKNMFSGLLDFIIGILKTIVGLFTGNTELVKEGIKQVFNGIGTFLKGVLQFWGGIFTIGAVAIVDIFKALGEKIKNVFSSIPSFVSGVINKIKTLLINLGKVVGNIISGALKAVINAILSRIESTLNTPIRTINGLTSAINKFTPFKLGKLSTFSLPRLARGGIVNNPGNGVFMGGYVAGERGAEAVLPLNDETFDRLGLAIGRHTSINATIPVYAYNRQVAREIRRIEANQSFATNGR